MSIQKFFKEALQWKLGGGAQSAGVATYALDSSGNVTGLVGPSGGKARLQSSDRKNIGTHTFAIGNMLSAAVNVLTPQSPSAQAMTFGATFEVPTDYDAIRLILASSSASIPIAAATFAPCSSVATSAAQLNDANFSTAAVPFLFNNSSTTTLQTGTGGSTGNPALLLSDWLAVSNIARTDGGTLPLVSVRVALTCASGTTQIPYWSCPSASFQTGPGPKFFSVFPSTNIGNFTSANLPGGYTNNFGSAIVGVQYISRRGVMSTLWIGDSITAGSALTNRYNNGFSQQSAASISSITQPVDSCVVGIGGSIAATQRIFLETAYAGATGGTTGFAAGATNLDALNPSHLVISSWFVNGTLGTLTKAQIDVQRQNVALMALDAKQRGITVILWNGLPQGSGSAYYDSTDITFRQAHNPNQKAMSDMYQQTMFV